jgi:hypothetical protein
VKFSISILVLVIAGFCACINAQSSDPVLAGDLNAAADSSRVNSVRLCQVEADSVAGIRQLIQFDQIKVFTDSIKAFKGSLVSMTWNDLTVNTGWSSIPVERSAARSIELYRRDTHNGVLRGALLGTAIGLVVCTVINVGYGIGHMKIVSFGEPEPEQTLVAIWSVPACTLVGSILGLSHRKKVATLTPDEFWERYQRQ